MRFAAAAAAALTLGSLAFAQSVRQAMARCDEDYVTCSEDCTMAFGVQPKHRDQLVQCVVGCKEAREGCRKRQAELVREMVQPTATARAPERPDAGSGWVPPRHSVGSAKPDEVETGAFRAPVPQSAGSSTTPNKVKQKGLEKLRVTK